MTKFCSDWIERNVYYRQKTGVHVPHYEQYERPVIVCLCGSTRFYEAFQKANYEETMAGKIVLSVGCYQETVKQRVIMDGCMGEHEVVIDVPVNRNNTYRFTEEQKIALDELHKRKIDLADEVLILSVDGYLGTSTLSEIDYAIKRGKTVRWLEKSAEDKYRAVRQGAST